MSSLINTVMKPFKATAFHDGEFVTIVEFESHESLAEWRSQGRQQIGDRSFGQASCCGQYDRKGIDLVVESFKSKAHLDHGPIAQQKLRHDVGRPGVPA